jgi:murein DD-endopeptidase MepM/ murein hydrolase activator NlpD
MKSTFQKSSMLHYKLLYITIGMVLGWVMMACGEIHEPFRDRENASATLVEGDGFDFPVGAPDAKGYYNAQRFGKNDHLGDDWNGVGGGNTDMGDTVFATAHGLCSVALNYYGGWGKIVRLRHIRGDSKTESLYAHLDEILVHVGDTVRRGQPIGTIGNAEGKYFAHLHFEIRNRWDMAIGGGYAVDKTGYLDPTEYVVANRPLARP